jgi:hypothetical protein
MTRKSIAAPALVWVLLIFQLVPLVLLPPKSFSPASQEWWLPVLCALLALAASLQLLIRRTSQLWPWYVMSFAHGINIISRLMMLMPRSTLNVKGKVVLNGLYLLLTVLAMLFSTFYLWYFEQHRVRTAFVRREEKQAT